jgi:aminopeptidase
MKGSWAGIPGGSAINTAGTRFIANMPTEEICTTPDWRKTQGKVTFTRPLDLNGIVVEGACFEFQDGRVINYSAQKGQNALDDVFAMDEQMRYLGEVALVSCSSPVYKENILFKNVLFDENASCHIAIGAGYSSVLPNGGVLSEKELSDAGCNMAPDHFDLMFGSEEINCIGVRGNERVSIMKNGRFVF